MQLLLQKIADKFIELSNIGFSMECFIADFSRFFGTTVQICLLSDPLGTGHQVQSISQIFLIFFFFLVWAQWPPSGENTVGISFDGKQYLHIYTKFKKVKTQYLILKLNLQIH